MKARGSTPGLHWKLSYLSIGEVSGIPSVAVKCVDIRRNTSGEGGLLDCNCHAASLHQGFPHCAIFPTAASRRSLGRVSVPMWPVTLSGRLLIVGLVGRYPTNYLIRRGSISYHRSFYPCTMRCCGLMRY